MSDFCLEWEKCEEKLENVCQTPEGWGGKRICTCFSSVYYIFILFKLSFIIVEHLSMAAAREDAELALLCQRGRWSLAWPPQRAEGAAREPGPTELPSLSTSVCGKVQLLVARYLVVSVAVTTHTLQGRLVSLHFGVGWQPSLQPFNH